MTRPFRFLDSVNSSSSDQPTPPVVDSDFVVILAALLCALICVLGLVAVARCAWIRRLSAGAAGSGSRPPPPPSSSAANKGVKKKVLKSLPKETFSPDYAPKFPDCAICLAEFAPGDEFRVLPQCGHGFHVSCIDPWLGSHSSCPSCRQILVVTRCQKCGGLPPPSTSAGGAEAEARLKAREDDGNRFLP
ncbi:RING-H2 finger protein ATL80 [Linum perenne]